MKLSAIDDRMSAVVGHVDTEEHSEVPTNTVHIPIGLLRAGPWNKTHTTMTMSSGFDCPYNSDGDYDADEDHPEMNVRCAELELLVNEVKDTEMKLMMNVNSQEKLARQLQELTDTNSEMIRKHESVVSTDAASPALGAFLGSWWREMRTFAQPWYSKYLASKQKELGAEESQLKVALTKAKQTVATLKAKYAAEDEAQESRHEDDEDKVDAAVERAETAEAQESDD